MVVSYTFYYGACGPKKPLLAADEAFHHLAQAGMDSYHAVISAERCLGLTRHVVACAARAVEYRGPKCTGGLYGPKSP